MGSIRKKEKSVKAEGLTIDTLYEYEGFMRRLILQYKEAKDQALSPLFLRKDKYKLRRKYAGYTVVSAPSHPLDTKKRGFHAVKELYAEVFPDIMTDLFVKETSFRQAEQSLSTRKKYLDNIKINHAILPKNKYVLIVDDIITTGSTIAHLSKSLTSIGYKVRLFAVYRHKMLES